MHIYAHIIYPKIVLRTYQSNVSTEFMKYAYVCMHVYIHIDCPKIVLRTCQSNERTAYVKYVCMHACIYLTSDVSKHPVHIHIDTHLHARTQTWIRVLTKLLIPRT